MDRQKRAYGKFRQYHTLTDARVNRRRSALSGALRPVPKFVVDGWASVCGTADTIRQAAKPDTDAKVLKVKLSPNWTFPYKVLAAGPCYSADTPDGSPFGQSSCIWIFLPICQALMLTDTYQFNAASHVPTPTTMVAFARRVDAIRAHNLLKEIPPEPRLP